MKSVMLGLVCAVAVAPVVAADLSLRTLLEEAKENQGAEIFMEFTNGGFRGGLVTEIGVDVFCVAPPANAWHKKDAVRCYPFTAVGGIERVGEKNRGQSIRVWMNIHNLELGK